MKPIRSSPIHSFFLEASFVLLFFALSSQVILQGFLRANEKIEYASEQVGAMQVMQNLIEEVKQCEEIETLPRYRYYDEEWVEIEEREARFMMRLQIEEVPLENGCYYAGQIEGISYRQTVPISLGEITFGHYIEKGAVERGQYGS